MSLPGWLLIRRDGQPRAWHSHQKRVALRRAILGFIRPRYIVTVAFMDTEPWSETFGLFRSPDAAHRFVDTLYRKGYPMLSSYVEQVTGTRHIKRMPDALPGRRRLHIPNQRKKGNT